MSKSSTRFWWRIQFCAKQAFLYQMLNGRTDIIMPFPQPQPPLPPMILPPPIRNTPVTSTITRPVSAISASTATPEMAVPSTLLIMPASQSMLEMAGPSRLPITRLGKSYVIQEYGEGTHLRSGSQNRQNLPVRTICGQPRQGHEGYTCSVFHTMGKKYSVILKLFALGKTKNDL